MCYIYICDACVGRTHGRRQREQRDLRGGVKPNSIMLVCVIMGLCVLSLMVLVVVVVVVVVVVAVVSLSLVVVVVV